MKNLFALMLITSTALAGECNCGKTCTAESCAAGCPMGQCYEWRVEPGTNGDVVALFYLGEQCGSYRYSHGVYLPLVNVQKEVWGKPCKLPTPAPKQHQHSQSYYAPIQYQSAPTRRSSSC